jgi:hypothetical protein
VVYVVADKLMVAEVLTFMSAGPPNWRRGNGVQRQLEYALASFVKETKKGEGSDG